MTYCILHTISNRKSNCPAGKPPKSTALPIAKLGIILHANTYRLFRIYSKLVFN